MFIQKRGHETKKYEHSQLSSRLDFLINVNMMSNCSCSAHKHILSYFYPQPFIYCPPRQRFSCSLSFNETCSETGVSL